MTYHDEESGEEGHLVLELPGGGPIKHKLAEDEDLVADALVKVVVASALAPERVGQSSSLGPLSIVVRHGLQRHKSAGTSAWNSFTH